MNSTPGRHGPAATPGNHGPITGAARRAMTRTAV